jgi:hypothetical protein
MLSPGAYWLPRLATAIRDSQAVLLLIGERIGKWQEIEYLDITAYSIGTPPAKKASPQS